MSFDVVVIGAGCVGTFTAFYLSKYDLKVLLLEKGADVSSGSTSANSGIVHSGHNTTPNTLKAQLVDRGNKIISELAPQLNFGFKRCGEVVVARSEEEYPQLLEMKKYSESIGVECVEWDAETIRNEEPNLNECIQHALFVPSAGVVNPYEMAVAVFNTAKGNGVKAVFDSKVQNIVKREGQFTVVTNRGQFNTKMVINAAGLFADEIARMVDKDSKISIMPRKGEEYLLNKDFRSLVSRIIFPLPTAQSKGTLVIPTVDGTIMVGPTAVDQQDKYDLATSQEGMTQVFQAVQQLVPKINTAMMISSFAGLRPVDISNDFVITHNEGFINLAGTQSPGLTACPAIAQEAVKFVLLTLESKEIDNWKLFPLLDKFGRVNMDRRAQMVKDDGNHSKIICTCEMVTEADVHNSITEGARTMDGVKIRTRAGMGGCQGGFCTTRIQRILADRLNVQDDSICKHTHGTELTLNEIGKQHIDIEDIFVKDPVPYTPISIEQSKVSVLCRDSDKKQFLSSLSGEIIPLFDIVIVGAGPAGLAAGLQSRLMDSNLNVLIIEKGGRSGGILIQCIHGGFGLKRYNQELTGPEYSELLTNECVEAGAKILLHSFVQTIEPINQEYFLSCIIGGVGFKKLKTKTIISAVGCKERTRFQVRISGTRPAGVYNAGLAQAMINLQGQMPGKRIAILGSGDIGLIMARRCTLEGAKVVGVYEIMPFVAGLKRNIAQCLDDFGIQYELSQSCVKINGLNRVESIEFDEVDEMLNPTGNKKIVECDCVLLAVGLIPITSYAVQAGGRLHSRTKNSLVDSYKSLNQSNSFAAGNCLQVHDLADDAAEEGEIAGRSAVKYLNGVSFHQSLPVIPGKNVGGLVPECIYKDSTDQQSISLRVRSILGHTIVRALSNGVILGETEVEEAVPAEMIHIQIDVQKLLLANDTVEIQAEQIQNVKYDVVAFSKILTCIVCPRGCKISVKTNQSNEIEEILGHSCPRGEKYARQEHIQPFRVFSSTVKINGCDSIQRLPVKLSKQIPRDKLLIVADHIKLLVVEAPIKMGQIVAKNIAGFQDVNIIACCSAEAV